MRIPKISNVIDLKHLNENLHYVQLSKNNIVATDGISLVVLDTNEILNTDISNSEFLSKLDEPIYIHKIFWDMIKTANYFEFISENVVKVSKGSHSVLLDIKRDIKYPNWKRVVPDNPYATIDKIGIDINMFKKLSGTLPYHIYKLTFTGKDSNIVVSDRNNKYKSYAIFAAYRLND